MGPKKNTRKGQKTAHVGPKAEKTITCTDCHVVIVVPRKCKHDKKPINCRSTECQTAHITAHARVCKTRAAEVAAKTAREEARTTETAVREEAESIAKVHAVLVHVVRTEIQNIEKKRGRAARYLGGFRKEAFLKNLEKTGVDQLREMAKGLKDLAEGKIGLEVAMYDDEDSDDDEEDRHITTPEDSEVEDEA